MSLYPVNLNVTDRHCLVVGGGRVALRKIRALLRYGALVCVVSPTVIDEVLELHVEGKIELKHRAYLEGDLQTMFLVFATTDQPQVQAQVAVDAKKYSVLLNSADNPKECDFQLPASFCRGDFQVAISTGGGSPAFSKMVRKQLEKHFGIEYEYTVCLLGLVRDMIVSDGASEKNKNILTGLLQEGLVECIKEEDWQKLQTQLTVHLPAHLDAAEVLDMFFRKCLLRKATSSFSTGSAK